MKVYDPYIRNGKGNAIRKKTMLEQSIEGRQTNQAPRNAGSALQRNVSREVMSTDDINMGLDELRGKDLRKYLMDVDLSEWAGENLGIQEAEAADQLRQRDLTVNGEQILRDLKNESAFEKSGVPRSKMPGRGQRMQNVLGTLKSDNPEGVVGPFVRSGRTKDGTPFEHRNYTREVDSPLIEGYKEVVPFENPETGKPLSTTFADANKMNVEGITVDPRWEEPTQKGFRIGNRSGKQLAQQGDLATELVTKHASWLAGGDLTDLRQANNVPIEQFRNANTFWDFKQAYYGRLGVDFTANGKPFDGEMLRDPKIAGTAQINTGIISDKGSPERAIRAQVKKVGLRDAPKAAGYSSYPGKTSVEKNYTILQPEWTPEFGNRNKAPIETFRQDKITEPIEAFRRIDAADVRSELDRLGPNIPDSQVSVAKVPSGTYKTSWRIPKGSPAVQDLSGTGGVPQIIKNLDYTVKPEAPIKAIAKGGGAKSNNLITQALDVTKAVVKNPGVRLAGAALGAIPILGDAADATTGTIDAVTKRGDQQVRGAGNAAAGFTGLAAVAAPAAAPLLGPISGGLAAGNLAADFARDRKQDRSIGESSKYERTGTFNHTEDNPVSIGLPGPVQSETQRRRQARRSSTGATPVARPQTGKQWWEQGVESVMNYFQ